MKIKFGTDKIFYLLILSYVAYIVVLIANHKPNPFYSFGPSEIAVYQNDLKPIGENIPDTISFKEYQKRKDSIITIRDLRNGDSFLMGSSVNIQDWAGTWSSRSCDTCSLKWFNKHFASADTSNTQYYIKLNGWTLNIKTRDLAQNGSDFSNVWIGPDSVEFYVNGKQAYIRKVLKKHQKSPDGKNYYLTDIPVKFRFHYKDKSLLIPVTKTTKKILDIIFIIFGIFLAVYIVTLLAIFFAFIRDLSRGKAFTDKNVTSLKLISLSLLTYPVLFLLLNFLTRIIFNSYFTPDVVFNSDLYAMWWKIALIGFVFYVLYRAFKAGKALKDEHDLTV